MTDKELIKDLDDYQKQSNKFLDKFLQDLSNLGNKIKEKYNYALIDDKFIKEARTMLYFTNLVKCLAYSKINSLKESEDRKNKENYKKVLSYDLDDFQESLNTCIYDFCFFMSKLSEDFKSKHNYSLIDDNDIKWLKKSWCFNDDDKQYKLNQILSLKNKGK